MRICRVGDLGNTKDNKDQDGTDRQSDCAYKFHVACEKSCNGRLEGIQGQGDLIEKLSLRRSWFPELGSVGEHQPKTSTRQPYRIFQILNSLKINPGVDVLGTAESFRVNKAVCYVVHVYIDNDPNQFVGCRCTEGSQYSSMSIDRNV